MGERGTWRAWVVGGLALLTSAQAGAGAAAPGGGASFSRYCAGCHGADARGGAARATSPAPADLTHLTPRFGPALPSAAVVGAVLDDRRPGGARICGEPVFDWMPAGPGRTVLRRGVLIEIVEYLRSHQAPAAAPDALRPGPAGR